MPGERARCHRVAGAATARRTTTKDGSMNPRPLVEAILTADAMLNDATRADVDPGWVVKVEEAIGECLDQIPLAERPEFCAVLEEIAVDAEREGNAELAGWVRQWIVEWWSSAVVG